MFTYIKVKNFLSLGDVSFDFKRSQNSINPFVVIYGENGSGKTNFVQVFSLLKHSINSFDYQQNYEDILSMFKEEVIPPNEMLQGLAIYSDFTDYLSSKRMVDCDEPTEVEYGFLMNNKEAIYHLTFTDHILNEFLYGYTGKQRGYLFKISSDEHDDIKTKLHPELIVHSSYNKEIKEKIQQYWGKHSFLSIITKQKKEKNQKFIEENVSPYLIEAIKQLSKVSVTNKLSNKNEKRILYNEKKDILRNLDNGIIAASRIKSIQKTESILRDFLTQTYADIKDVEYEVTPIDDNRLKYRLYVDKMISGKIRRIDFMRESAGTQQILDIFRSLIGLFFGVTVVYDEIDNGVHDILLAQIINSLQGEITGQLIITTHNTMLLEVLDEHYIYVINTDYMGNKSVHSAAEYGIQTNHNLRARYIKGLLGGVPYIDGVDYEAIESVLAERGDPSWQEK